MSKINQLERITQNRVIQLFRQDLGYVYLGDLHEARALIRRKTAL